MAWLKTKRTGRLPRRGRARRGRRSPRLHRRQVTAVQHRCWAGAFALRSLSHGGRRGPAAARDGGQGQHGAGLQQGTLPQRLLGRPGLQARAAQPRLPCSAPCRGPAAPLSLLGPVAMVTAAPGGPRASGGTCPRGEASGGWGRCWCRGRRRGAPCSAPAAQAQRSAPPTFLPGKPISGRLTPCRSASSRPPPPLSQSPGAGRPAPQPFLLAANRRPPHLTQCSQSSPLIPSGGGASPRRL